MIFRVLIKKEKIMCKYCECKTNPNFPSLGARAETIAKSNESITYIEEISGSHYLVNESTNKGYSIKLNRCPFCFRVLTRFEVF